jgi:hypothetical protein
LLGFPDQFLDDHGYCVTMMARQTSEPGSGVHVEVSGTATSHRGQARWWGASLLPIRAVLSALTEGGPQGHAEGRWVRMAPGSFLTDVRSTGVVLSGRQGLRVRWKP